MVLRVVFQRTNLFLSLFLEEFPKVTIGWLLTKLRRVKAVAQRRDPLLLGSSRARTSPEPETHNIIRKFFLFVSYVHLV